MTVLDIFFFIFLCWFGFLGLKNGLIYEISSLAALILGVWGARSFSYLIASWLPESNFTQPAAFCLTFFIVILLVHLVGKGMKTLITLAIPNFVDHLFGLLFGACKIIVATSVIFYFIQTVDKKEVVLTQETKSKSISYKYVAPVIPTLLAWDDFKANIQDKVQDQIQDIKNQFQ